MLNVSINILDVGALAPLGDMASVSTMIIKMFSGFAAFSCRDINVVGFCRHRKTSSAKLANSK